MSNYDKDISGSVAVAMISALIIIAALWLWAANSGVFDLG